MNRSVLIVGAGQAAAVAARTLRRRGFDGAITLVGDEAHAPYQRPPLSKEYLQGEEGREGLFLLSEEWRAKNGIDLRCGQPATALDPGERSIDLADGSKLSADTILLATGARPRPLPGVHGDRVHYLRSIDDSEAIRARLTPGSHVIVIGAGFVGGEVAASARSLGTEVTVVEALGLPLQRVLGPRLAQACADIHRRNGVNLRFGEAVASVAESRDGVAVTTSNGGVVEGDAVVVGAGVVPNTGIAESAGIKVVDGIVIDEYGHTSHEGIFAAGDVANQYHPLFGRHVRVEHFDNANKQAAAVAKNILGRKVAHNEPPWFWSDQYGLNLQHVGAPHPQPDLVIRGSIEDLDFIAFGIEAGVLRSAFAVERGDDIPVAQELIANETAVDPRQLSDPDIELSDLLGDDTW